MSKAHVRAAVPTRFSEGAERLWKEMKKRKLTQGQLQRLLGVKPGVVSRWLYGERLPDTLSCAAIEKEFGIQVSAWVRPAKGEAPAKGTGTDG